MDCEELFFGCWSYSQWISAYAWFLIGGAIFYIGILFNGIKSSRKTSSSFELKHFLVLKNFIRLSLAVLTGFAFLRFASYFAPQFDNYPAPISGFLAGLSIEIIVEIMLHKGGNIFNKDTGKDTKDNDL